MRKSDLAISARGVCKQYLIAHDEKHYTLAEAWLAKAKHPWRRAPQEQFNALQDISFEIKKGDVVGIIGRNGAGKSTLLKILSRITEPTSGQIDLYGRVGSLLEVGTGFHPELTGRENVYLNGAILGMKRQEISRQFDAIVAFAEIEQFLDTPVKRYSSGMYVRLAFAVAAHLNPEILIVDEVLAVGDVQFQKKCLGKMKDVSQGSGRTVLFVSHNMTAIGQLCRTAIYLKQGRIAASGAAEEIVAQYIDAFEQDSGSRRVWEADGAPGNADLKLLEIRTVDAAGGVCQMFQSGGEVIVELSFRLARELAGLSIGFDLLGSDGAVVLRTYGTDLPVADAPRPRPGHNRWQCRLPAGLLNAGRYRIAPRLSVHNAYWIVNDEPVLTFDVVLSHGVSPYWACLDGSNRPGAIAPILPWAAVG